jgi:hypothetical protein
MSLAFEAVRSNGKALPTFDYLASPRHLAHLNNGTPFATVVTAVS